jgi:glycosyltransferase involved in cell wall biosynthesis
MRVAHVIPTLASTTGGPAVMVVELAHALARAGVESPVFTTTLAAPAHVADGRKVSRRELPARAGEIEIRFFPARWPYRLAFSPALDRALAGETSTFDVVHIHSLFLFPQFSGYRHAARAAVPYVVSQHGALDAWLRRRGRVRKSLTNAVWQRRMLDGAAALHVASAGEAESVADVAPSVPRVVVPFGIHAADYDELPDGEEFRRGRLRGHDGPLVLNIGRISEKKGLDVLVQAFAVLARDLPDARLALVGPDDGLTPSLAALADREGIGSKVVFTGPLHGRDKLAALAAADAWALPSRTEAFPMAVLEALVAGRPCVITPAVNNAPDIAAAGAALVCDPTPAAFGERLLRILTDREQASRLGDRARSFGRGFDWAIVAPRWVEAYAHVAGAAS